MIQTPRDSRDTAVARASMYRFLAALYLGPPEAQLLRLLSDGDLVRDLIAFFGAAAADVAAVCDMAGADHALAAIAQDYMDLFAAPSGRYVAPFEDPHRGGVDERGRAAGPLLGEHAVAVRRAYREGGAEIDRRCRELPTHIGVELSFMAVLCEREAAAMDDEQGPDATEEAHARERQRAFLDEHLAAWAPGLCRAVRERAATPFYRGAASLTEAFIAWDAAGLGESVAASGR